MPRQQFHPQRLPPPNCHIANNEQINNLRTLSEINKATIVETGTESGTIVQKDETAGVEEPYHWYLKTNLPAWALLITNIQAEMDVASHFSVMLPIYYSGWNYFHRDLKLRIFAMLPEARYWLKSENQGLFFGAHAGFSYYNYATPGKLRYQDRDGNHPAYGGGLTVGYRLPIRKSSPWQFEFSAGFGIYHLDYDKFNNCPNGLLVGHGKRTFYGVDNVAVTLSYRFNMTRKRKGGVQ